MTVIAWDGKALAADKRATNCGLVRTLTKIKRVGNLLVGASGDISATAEAISWVERGRKITDWPEIQRNNDDHCSLLVIDADLTLVYEKSPIPASFEDRIFAIGSGRDFALSAMHCGKTAAEAVQIACLFDAGCGNGVDVLFQQPIRKGRAGR